ncbi:MAG: hypothetical protein ACRES8_01575 [Nevskiaceae bacterium]
MKAACALAALLFLPAAAFAQDEMPALPDEEPAIPTERLAPVRPATGGVEKARTGTTVIGDQESPIGLYIMPWRQSQAQAGLDRPARLLDEALLPLDPEVFRRQVEYHRALNQHLQDTGRGAP